MVIFFLKLLYFLWLVGFLILYTQQSLPSALAVIAVLLLLLSFLVFREKISYAFGRLRISPYTKFTTVGTAFALLVEAIYIFTPDPIHPNLLVDWLIMAPFYYVVYATWWVILRHYRFSLWELFFLAGMVGALIEGNIKILLNPIAILLVPHAIAVHGAMIIPPTFSVMNEIGYFQRKESRLRYFIALLPALWVLPFLLVWLPLVSRAFNN